MNKNDELFMKVNFIDNSKICYVNNSLARKYAQLKKTRHHRAGKQHSVDDDEEDIGRIHSQQNNFIYLQFFQIMHLIVLVGLISNDRIDHEHLCVDGIYNNV
jgi:hypothetical protein